MEFVSRGLEVILDDINQCPYTENEKQIKCTDKAIKCFKDIWGSERYILYLDGVAVSGLQIMIEKNGIVRTSNVITIEQHRRKGYAGRIWIEVKKHHTNIVHSTNLSELGKIYVKKFA